jgi:hypothetical protein
MDFSALNWMRRLLAVLLLLLLSRSPGSFLSAEENGWNKLFDGHSLQNWRSTRFGGEGNVEVNEGQIILNMGNDLTGINWSDRFPTVNYEVMLAARRLAGSDFFCGITFPVNESPCSLIIGGWGGTVVGLSSIDDRDASENETGRLMNFELGRWYAVRLRVTESKIEAWIDEKQVVDLTVGRHKISVRPEVELSRPFGIASWRTKAALRDIKLRTLDGAP